MVVIMPHSCLSVAAAVLLLEYLLYRGAAIETVLFSISNIALGCILADGQEHLRGKRADPCPVTDIKY